LSQSTLIRQAKSRLSRAFPALQLIAVSSPVSLPHAEQSRASKALIAADTGIFVAPTGTGKTVLGIHLVAQRARSALILVHPTQLLDQWRAQLALFLDLPEKEIGQIGGGSAG
jgi:superfamily II DNA or RNA helicase